MKCHQLHTKHAYTRDEMQRILGVADRWLESGEPRLMRAGMFAWWVFGTGLRFSEILRVRWEDITEDGRARVWRHKRRGRNWVKGEHYSGAEMDLMLLPSALLTRLERLRQQSGLVFQPLRKQGRKHADEWHRITSLEQSLREDWRKILRAAEVSPRRVHDGRHTVGTLIGRSQGVFAVRDFLGHRSIETSNRYVEIDWDGVARAQREMFAAFVA